MTSIKVKDITLFEILLEFDIDGEHIDLHNDFSCRSIRFSKSNNTLILLFKHDLLLTTLTLTFCDVSIVEINMDFDGIEEGLTLDLLYRGRYEVDGKLFDVSDDGRGYLYMESCEGQSIEFFCMEYTISREEPLDK